MLTKLRVIFWLTVCISVFVCSSPANTAGDNAPVWKPVTPEELQMKAPKVEADADAEAIFWEVKIDDKKLESVYYDHYIRVKIFTERARERFSKFDIPFAKGKKIENVAA